MSPARHPVRTSLARDHRPHPLDNDALRAHVPSIFAGEAHDSRSDRYVYVPTTEIVEGLRREGWQPFFAVQSVSRDGSRHGQAEQRAFDNNAQRP